MTLLKRTEHLPNGKEVCVCVVCVYACVCVPALQCAYHRGISWERIKGRKGNKDTTVS